MKQILLTLTICIGFTLINLGLGSVQATGTTILDYSTADSEGNVTIANANGSIHLASDGQITFETEQGFTVRDVGGGRTREVLIYSTHFAAGDVDTDSYGEQFVSDTLLGTALANSPGNQE